MSREGVPVRRIRSAILFLLLPVPFVLGAGPNSHRPRACDWTDSVFVPAFSADEPPPIAVVLHYQRYAAAVGRVENVQPEPCGVVFMHRIQMRLSLPGGRVLDEASAEGSETRFLAGFDGSDDFDGDSGDALVSVNRDTTTLVLDDPADIAWFAGVDGAVALTVAATGFAELAGPESLRHDVDLRAGVRITVEYVTNAEP